MMDDLISRQAAIDAINKEMDGLGNLDPTGWGMMVARDCIIEKLPSAQQWISVKDQAPPEGTHCLANIRWSADDNEVCELDYTFWPNKSAVTHWMPLPEPPKGGE